MGSGCAAAGKSQTLESVRAAPIETENFKSDRFEITFVCDDGQEKPLQFTSRPLDMEICWGMVPMRVINVDRQGLAHRSGVERGWTIRRISATDMTGKTFEEQFSILKAAMISLPTRTRPTLPVVKAESVEIVFIADGDKKEVPVVFSKKPLGFDCEVVAPIKVKNIKEDCVARRSGVEVGWIVKKIDGVDISTFDIDSQIKCLKESVAALPDIDYCIAPPLGHYMSGGVNEKPRATDEGSSTADGRL